MPNHGQVLESASAIKSADSRPNPQTPTPQISRCSSTILRLTRQVAIRADSYNEWQKNALKILFEFRSEYGRAVRYCGLRLANVASRPSLSSANACAQSRIDAPRHASCRGLAAHPVAGDFCRDGMARTHQKQQLNAVTAMSKNYVAKNVIPRMTRQILRVLT